MVWFGKNWELENGKKKNRGFGIPKIAKTGNIGKKSPVAGDIDYVRYLSMQKFNTGFTFFFSTISIKVHDSLTLHVCYQF